MSSILRGLRGFARTSQLKTGQHRWGRRNLSASEAEVPPKSTFYAPRRNPLFSPTMIVVGIIPFFTFALGTWQVERLKWKIALIDELEEKLQRDPIFLPNRVNLAVIPEFTHRKVILRGVWDHAHSMLIGPRVRDGVHGYHLVTPLKRPGGSTILINRGFVAKDKVAVSLRGEGDDGREHEVLGMLRMGHVRNYFTPDNHPEKGEWFWADTDAMAEYAGGARADVQPVFVDEVFEGHGGEATYRVSRGIPVGRLATIDVRNAHASYVVTWYSLSALTSAMFVVLLLKQRRAVKGLPRYT
ncbi:hypothetical protein JAAARDRAFT_374054 [Jaapia argillacea MUCL 33604]|uniref:SURF1-like protein n=1 Tax=Jaapia argillacea MUCL 33604 TaxID=933084 RepID=A0A067QIF6_9AGAM|nr:hypothetical protein JAAARDRAFT_374054 [Jaapia argillacea MUCL 33604]